MRYNCSLETGKQDTNEALKVSVRQPVYPFTAIVGQERMKRALILNAVNPASAVC
jgi:Mg-chelatase subunit ChlI